MWRAVGSLLTPIPVYGDLSLYCLPHLPHVRTDSHELFILNGVCMDCVCVRLSSVAVHAFPFRYTVQSNVASKWWGHPVSTPSKTPPFPAPLALVLEFSISPFALGSIIFKGAHSLHLWNPTLVQSFSLANSQIFYRVIGEVKERAKSGRRRK